MKFNTINCLFLSIICLISCGNKNNKEIELMQIDSSARVLFVDNTKAFVTIPKDSLFDAKYEIIPLETTVESLIGQIGRISMHNDNLYILDKRLSSVLIFNRSGKFLNKISHIGKGPGEYLSLTDFGIDTKTNNIILYCDRPKKIITYSLGDELQNETSIEQLFESISLNSDTRSLIGINRMPIYKDYFIKYDLEKRAINESFIPITSNKVEKMFSNYKSEFPLWIKSKHDYCVIPYVNTIHQSKGDTLKKSFSLKFQNELSNFEGGEKAANGLIKTAINDNLGFWYSNFRENDSYLTFSYGRGTKVFYPLDNDKYTTFDFVQNSEFNYPHSYHFAHDFYGKSNEDNYYVFVEEPTSLIGFYNEMKSNSPSDWNKVSDQAKEKITKLKIEDNPLLFIFRIKK